MSEWITANLVVPDGPFAGEPLVLTREQLEILVRFYRLHPKTGASVYRRAAVVRPKGWGKSPFLAAIALAETCGPVRFQRWEKGEPTGAPPPTPWVQVAACSEDQTANTYRSLLGMVAEGSPIVANYGLDVGVTKVIAPGGGLIETVTAAAGTREGQRVTFAVLDETHLWDKASKGTALAATIRRNVAKMDGRTFESTNAWEPGRDSVAEKTAEAAEAKRPGILFDHRTYAGEFSLFNKTELRKAIRYVYGESAKPQAWIDPNRIIAEVHDPATTEADARRFYLNEVCAPPDQWVTEEAWESLASPVAPEPLSEVTAGFVGRAYQGAALIACRIDTGELWTVATWETAGDEMVSRSEVNAAVEKLMGAYLVRRFYVNPQEWASEYDAWALAFGEDVVVTRPPQQTANQAYAVDRFRTAVGAKELHHDGNEVLRRHVLGAQTKTVAAGTLIVPRTESPADQITAAKSAVLAWEARADVLTVEQEEPSVYEDRGLVVLG